MAHRGPEAVHLGLSIQEYCQPAVTVVKFPPTLTIAPLFAVNLNDWCRETGIATVAPSREFRAPSSLETPFITVLPPDQKLESKDAHSLGRK